MNGNHQMPLSPHHLRAQKERVEFRQLVLYVGDLGRHYDGGLRFEEWGESLEGVYECNRDGHRKCGGKACCGKV